MAILSGAGLSWMEGREGETEAAFCQQQGCVSSLRPLTDIHSFQWCDLGL